MHLSVDVRVSRLRRERHLRLHALRQSDARCARRSAGGARGRRGGHRHGLGHGGDHAGLSSAASRANCSSRRTTAMAALTGCLPRSARKRPACACEFVDQTDAGGACAPPAPQRPRLVWVETPSNPLLRIVDIRAVARQAQAARALLVVDNTFLSPAWQQPHRARRRYRGAFDDQVPQRAQRRGRRRGDSPHAGTAGAAAVVGELPRPHRRAVRQLPHAARHCARCMRGCAVHEQNARSVVAALRGEPGGDTRLLPGACHAPRPQRRRGPAERVRRDGQFRSGRRCAGGGGLRQRHRLLLAGRIARRRREPGRASGHHDACGDGSGGAPPRRNLRCAGRVCPSASRARTTCWPTCRRPWHVRARRRRGAV